MSATLLAQIVDAARDKITAGRYVEVFFGDRRSSVEPLSYSGTVQVRYDLTAVQPFQVGMVPGQQRNGFSPLQRSEPCEAIISCQSTAIGATEDEHMAYLVELSDAVADALFGAARAKRVEMTNMAGTFITFADDQTSMRGIHYRLAFTLTRGVVITANATSAAPSVAAITTIAGGISPQNVCAD